MDILLPPKPWLPLDVPVSKSIKAGGVVLNAVKNLQK